MSKRSKYSHNGVYRCRNFAQHVENDNFPRSPIGRASDLFGWSIRLIKLNEKGRTWVYPFISHNDQPNLQIRAYFNIIKKDGSSAFEREIEHLYLKPSYGCKGWYMDIDELLDEKNGYLDEGALTVEYGLQVESVEGADGIWKFNLHDNFFDWKTQGVYMLEFNFRFDFIIQHEGSIFGHKQLIKMHPNTIAADKKPVPVLNLFGFHVLLMCLQITHGVRLQIAALGYRRVARVAYHLGFSNTVRYCERRLIEMKPKLKIRSFKLAVKCNMRCYLVHLLKRIEYMEELFDILRRLHLKEMSSESMKAIVAKIFSL